MANEMQDPNKEYTFPWHSYKKSHLADDAFVFSVPNCCRHHGSRFAEQNYICWWLLGYVRDRWVCTGLLGSKPALYRDVSSSHTIYGLSVVVFSRLWALGEVHNSLVTWFSAEINTHPLSNKALKQRSCSFALLKDHRTPLSRAMPLTRGSWSGSSPVILHCVSGSVLLMRAASCTAKHPQHHGAAFPSLGIEDFVWQVSLG